MQAVSTEASPLITNASIHAWVYAFVEEASPQRVNPKQIQAVSEEASSPTANDSIQERHTQILCREPEQPLVRCCTTGHEGSELEGHQDGRGGATAGRVGTKQRALGGEDAGWRPRGATEGGGARQRATHDGEAGGLMWRYVEVETVQGLLPGRRSTSGSGGVGAWEELENCTRAEAADGSCRRAPTQGQRGLQSLARGRCAQGGGTNRRAAR